MNKKLKKQLIKTIKIVLGVFLLILSLFTAYNLVFSQRIFPGISVAGIYSGGRKPAELKQLLLQKIKTPEKINLKGAGQNSEIVISLTNFQYNFDDTSQRAFSLYRSGNFFLDLYQRVGAFWKKHDLGLSLELDENKLNETLSIIANQNYLKAKNPSVGTDKGNLVVEGGNLGKEVDIPKLRILIGHNLAYTKGEEIEIPYRKTGYVLNDNEILVLKSRAQKLVGKSLLAKYDQFSLEVKGNSLLSTLDAKNEYNFDEIAKIVQDISTKLNRPPQNPVLVVEGKRAKEFAPSKDGYLVKEDSLKDKIIGNIRSLENTEQKEIVFDIPVILTAPKVKTGEINNLGIKDLLGKGSSNFFHSIPNRIYNISLASSKFKGVLIPPGEILSFNNFLGDISAFTGYKQAYIIKDGKTILGDGGGVCQVSTTLFRAALNAGLPILERQPHAYRVSYYEQNSPPGIDATVYYPTTDLKIKNDTPAYILIQPIFDEKNYGLAFEIYGTSDGRIASLSKSIVSEIVAPAEDLYTDDPTLPSGQIKQIDFKAWGAKVKFDYKVQKNGEIIYKKTFVSNYRPWQAVYLKGTKS